ncbi:DUF4062 domain-containing protein [Actinoplanes sp. TRM 88003]|uniref:DUF4062 domain-containing protein n=1 Tax=Paractinoplanes aksuensis TaxID=2939490 RepID=A0ABT1E0Z9_9ACTN|nr:DUF4062 domain-containing protein [Actinoplanes aksuensis]MCO8275845.1 DUF4062 domain-containing protein [Actinoplanes aksuensis]
MTASKARPWRVFLSHTSELEPFVHAAKEAVTRAGHIPVDMRYFAAVDSRPSEVCMAAVESADVYVLIAGSRYGSSVRDRPEVSYTELEFLTAGRAGLPRLAFLLDVPAEPRQQSFRDRVTDSDLTAAKFTDPSSLETRVYQALIELERRHVVPVWSVPPLRGSEVARPALTDALVEAVLAPGAGTVGVTTGLVGAGGFGKTTLARMVAHRVRDDFPGGVAWITVGEDASGPELAATITSAARLFDPAAPEVTDPLAAGASLGRALADRQVLLVIDDVWTSEQVDPFLLGGARTVRLFTTRQRDVLPPVTDQVPVDQMAADEARRMLGAGLPAALVDEALAATGRWPVLLALLAGAVDEGVEAGGEPARELTEILRALRADGITVLDVGDENSRSQAVAGTIEAGLRRLTEDERLRYLELAVFGEDVTIPGEVVARLWAHTGRWAVFRSRRFLARLHKLSLLAAYRRDPDEALLHDVVRAYLRHRTADRRAELDRAVVDAHRSLTPKGWAALPAEERYLWVWLAAHLRGAGLRDELEALLDDPEWLIGKLQYVGAAALEADLSLADRRALATAVRQNAHVLTPMDSPKWLAATLASRIAPGVGLDRLRDSLWAAAGDVYLRPFEPLADRPHPALIRVLPGLAPSAATAVAPDGGWIAFAADDGTIRLRDPITGGIIATLRDTPGDVRELAVAPDSTWLAAGCADGSVWILDTRTGARRGPFEGATGRIAALAVASDGTWLVASGTRDRVPWIWDAGTGAARFALAQPGSADGPPLPGRARCPSLLLDPRGRWIGLLTRSGTVPARAAVSVWDLRTGTGRQLGSPSWHEDVAVAVAPTGDWIATASTDGRIEIWDCEDWTPRTIGDCHEPPGPQIELAVAADGRWLAVRGDNLISVADLRDGRIVAELVVFGGSGGLLFGPDGTWLAATEGESVIVWNTADWSRRNLLTGHAGDVTGLVASGDGGWLASASPGRAIRVWDPAVVGERGDDVGRDNPAWEGDFPPVPASEGLLRRPTTWQKFPRAALLSMSDRSMNTWWNSLLAFGEECTRIVATIPGPGDEWRLISFGDDHVVRLWDDDTEAPLRAFDGQLRTIPEELERTSVAAAADGTWLALAEHSAVHIWDQSTGRRLHTLATPSGQVSGLAATSEGLLCSVGADAIARVWDPARGTLIAAIRFEHPLTGVTALDGRITAEGGGLDYLFEVVGR